ncbi:MAG: DNA-binding response regulator [Candidatus Hydrogenedentota bacterium]|nr:MAG: DNA-binding response regulator [Candidatus Hydrogenedentota bacterium]
MREQVDNTILVVEDEEDIRSLIRFHLEKEGFRVIEAGSGTDGLRLARDLPIELLILDRMVPGLDGDEVCRLLKADSLTESIPILMLTAKTEETDVVVGLALGADDYVRKPFGTKELVARVKALLRRSERKRLEEKKGGCLERAGVRLDRNSHRASVNGREISLTVTEWNILENLMERDGAVMTRREILSRCAAAGTAVVERNVDVHIRSIRKKLGDRAGVVETVRGIGYRFRASRSRNEGKSR